MNMKKLFLFLLPAVMLGMFASCDETEGIDNQGPDNNNPSGSVSVKANQVKIGDKVISFDIKDTLMVMEGGVRMNMNGYDPSATSSTGSLYANFTNDMMGKDINLSLTNLMDSIYDPLNFDFTISGGSDSMFLACGFEYNENIPLRVLSGAINTDTIHSIFQTGTLRMDLDASKKMFTFKINATLYNGGNFELFVSIPYVVEYIFNFYTYSHETWDQYHGYKSLTDFSAFDPISDYLETFTLEAADTTGQAKLAVFKEAVGRLETMISMVNDSIAKQGFYDDKDCFMVKLVTWGFGGGSRVLAYKKWFKTYVDTWIPSDDALRAKLYSTEDEDYWESYGED